MGFGAVIAAINTMYASVSTRWVEIGTLRSLGFSNVPVVVSVMVESLLLALVGGLLGVAVVYLLYDVVNKFKCPTFGNLICLTFGNLICLTFGNFIRCGRRRRKRSDRRLLRVSPSLRTCGFVLPHTVAGALDIHHMATMQ